MNMTISRIPAERLSAKHEKRYLKVIADIEKGRRKTVSFADIKKLMEYLNS